MNRNEIEPEIIGRTRSRTRLQTLVAKMGLNDDVDLAKVRKDERLDVGSTALLIFKATVGLGLYSYQYGFGKVGIIAGFIFSFLQGIFVAYPMWRLVKMADTLEKERTQEQKGMFKVNLMSANSLMTIESTGSETIPLPYADIYSEQLLKKLNPNEEIIVKRY